MCHEGGEPVSESRPFVAAVFNTSPDTVEMLRVVLTQAGFVVVSGYTFELRDLKVDLDAFMRQHQPNVIVYDLAPPYEENCRLFEHLRATPAFEGRPIVITSTNAAQVHKLLQPDQQVYEVIGKPYDLGIIVQAVKEAVRSRPTQ